MPTYQGPRGKPRKRDLDAAVRVLGIVAGVCTDFTHVLVILDPCEWKMRRTT